MSARRWITALVMMCLALAYASANASAADFEQERQEAFKLGVQAYIYGQPLLDTERVYDSTTSVTVADHIGDAPVNQFSHFVKLATEKEGVVVAPNADTLYSIAWLKLNRQPMVLHVPETEAGRLNVVEMLSPYTENFANIGQGTSGMLAPGSYVVAGPGELEGQQETEGLKIIRSPYDRVWLIARTLVEGSEDVPNALAVQEATKIVPLSRWARQGLNYKAAERRKIITTPPIHTIPGTKLGEPRLRYWAALGRALARFTPPDADTPLLEQLATVNIGPGKAPKASNSGKGTLLGLQEAVEAGPLELERALKAQFEAGFEAHNGWLVAGLGHYGTDYLERALADKTGLGAPTPNLSIYPLALTERHGVKLTGANRYVAHFPASDFPVPVTGFWSMTMYEVNGFFVANPLNRFTLGNRSDLHFNADGSLDVYLQAAEPANEVERENWLPAPAGEFELIMRLYGVYEEDIPGVLEGGPTHWQPPTILPCLANGETAAGWACAE